ncbi:MAG: T9SS type A sorting domain-containing protein, partial [Prevotellaceae bacterium]|nr:T9SS type A sorting domain-containing protein [Prevotellaceae bacterium]
VVYADNLNAGTATVTITGAGNYDGATDVTFNILKADQTISFPDIPDLLLINGPYRLQATATSGLPVTYTSSNPAIADIGSDGVTLLLKDFGPITVTASQQGDNNYNPAPPVQKQVNVVESGNTAASVTVFGAKFDAVNSRYVMNCSENSVTVIVEPEDYTARVYYNNVLGPVFSVTKPTGVHSITYTVKSGAKEQIYTLEIAKPFKFDDVVKMRWDNTLTVINNPANNGGFHFTSFVWYGDGRLITANQSFSAGNTGQTIDPAISYHVALEADEYTGALNTCPSLIALRHSAADMVAYPNPAQSNGFVFVEINMDEAQLDHAEIEIFNIVGVSVGKVRVAGQITPVNMSSLPTGVYLLNLRGKKDLNKIVKVVVQ